MVAAIRPRRSRFDAADIRNKKTAHILGGPVASYVAGPLRGTAIGPVTVPDGGAFCPRRLETDIPVSGPIRWVACATIPRHPNCATARRTDP